MATATANPQAAAPARFPGFADKWAKKPGKFLDSTGKVGWFAIESIREIVHAIRHYPKEIIRLIAEVGMGAGAMAVVGGTVAIVGFVTL
jgi:phospholipid/cholesterol/gamma-HCH transport system permease protein